MHTRTRKPGALRPATRSALERVERALAHLASGGVIIVVDDFDRENEGDFLMAAEKVTPEAVNFMATEGRGLICQTITASRAGELDLTPQALANSALHGTAFTVSVDAAAGVTSGISAADRAHTMRLICDSATTPADLVRPGHIFPLVARDGGVLARRGHTEAGCDLARLAGLTPSAVICEIISADGTMARLPELEVTAERFDLPLVSVDDLALYRSLTGDVAVQRVAAVRMPTVHGEFEAIMYSSEDPFCAEAVVIHSLPLAEDGRLDTSRADRAPLVRLHSQCLTGESFGSVRCDCGAQLDTALAAIAREAGAVVYLRQEGRAIGLAEKFRAYRLQDGGMDTVEANRALGHRDDERSYGAAVAVLRRLGITSARVLTNNPEKMEALLAAGIEVERVPHEVGLHQQNHSYLATKASRMGHQLSVS